ncbi:MAG: cytochrome b/b6 domain-containing protein [Xanthomonadales bacterium]|nr:cytochrome b/b6 domain-containing protein [Xanthomonadales bacterium]NIX11898.1 cytochrome b/b6 domain-containing protein [Xanthomonadales bacterium]
MEITRKEDAANRDAMVRWFHWINVIVVLLLAVIGAFIWNAKTLGMSDEGKVLLKQLHALCGYVFAVNLLVRLAWAFVGGEHARWRSLLPLGRGFPKALASQARNLFRPEGHDQPGHSPLGRISVTLMLACMLTMAVTGLVLAGTDIYYPPLGGRIAEWVAADGVDPADVAPNRPELVDEAAYREMRAFRSPFIDTHKFVFFMLLALVPLHVAGVVLAEHKGGRSIVSSMITGRAYMKPAPQDQPEAD